MRGWNVHKLQLRWIKSRTQNTLQELNQKRTSHLSLQLSSDQSVSVHPVLQSLPLMLSNFITNYCVSSVSSNYIVFKCSALMEHLMKHVTRRCLCSQGFCAWEWVQINFGTVEEVETTHDGFRPHTLFTAVIQNSVQKVPHVIRTWWSQRRRSSTAGCLCCQSPEHWHVTWTQTSDQCSSGDASRWGYKHIHTSPAAIDRVMRLTGGHIGAGKLRLLICESLVKQALSIHDTAPDSSISWTKLQ